MGNLLITSKSEQVLQVLSGILVPKKENGNVAISFFTDNKSDWQEAAPNRTQATSWAPSAGDKKNFISASPVWYVCIERHAVGNVYRCTYDIRHE